MTRSNLNAVDWLLASVFAGYGTGDGRFHEMRGRENFREWVP